MGYTVEGIYRQLEAAASDMSQFYKRGFINYRGKTTDTKEYYTEVIAGWLLEHLDLLDQIKVISRQSPYRVDGHDGIPDHPDSNREEELIAMAMKRQGTMPIVGRILDYQTPLKNVQRDKAGKIDLLAYDGTTLRILELKDPDSKETMLRCVLESYTYLKTVDQVKLLADFELDADTKIEACPFVFLGSYQWQEMQQHRPNLKRLMEVLSIKPFYVQKDTFIVTEE